MNPYENTRSQSTDSSAKTARSWPSIAVVCVCIYYTASALTLPFAGAVWIGEFPPLAIVQFPKSILKSVVHQGLMSAVHAFGWSHGSRSPDYSMIHPWAMAIMAIAPALLLIAIVTYCTAGRTRIRLVQSILIFATLDALVTFWIDLSSNWKLFNAQYF
ncbi:hypothetical protein [Novipirellula rosea]|uniref:hypothetical protein n=1 Tax=Novipirellula rosea TaxID=1031540 RepID=UPI0031EE2E8A